MTPGRLGSSTRRYMGVNIYHEPISLEVTRDTSVTRISVKKLTHGFLSVSCLLWTVFSTATFAFFFDKLQIAISYSIWLHFAFLFYWITRKLCAVIEERIEVMDFLHGIQYTQVRRFGCTDCFFIHSQRVILHEVISMQRIILYISCLKGLEDDVKVRSENRSKFQSIPLFTHLHPRQDLLQVLYNHLLDVFLRNRKNHSVRNGFTNGFVIKSKLKSLFPSNHHRRRQEEEKSS